MTRGLIGVAVSLTLTAGITLAPGSGLAQQFHGQMGGGRVTGGQPFVSHPFPSHPFPTRPFVSPSFPARPFVPQPVSPRPFVPQPVSPRPFVPNKFPQHRFFPHHFHRSFIPLALIAPPAVAFAQSITIYAPPTYYDPSPYDYQPASYDPPAYNPPASDSVSLAPPSPPAPSVIQYPTGRYELRGDGTTAPYTWVWIPNPPPAPPAGPPTESPTPSEPSSSRHGELYRWTDADGVLHVTDRLETVPPQHRAQSKPIS